MTFHAATQTRWGPKGKNEHSKRAEVRLPQSCILKSPLSHENFPPPAVYKSILEEQKCETAMRTHASKQFQTVGWRYGYGTQRGTPPIFAAFRQGPRTTAAAPAILFRKPSALYLDEADWTTWSYGSFLNYGKANQCIVSPWQGRFGLGLLSQYFQGWPVPCAADARRSTCWNFH
jgi:hypothetical protein